MKNRKCSPFSLNRYQKYACPFCGHYFYPGEIDEHVVECEPVEVHNVGTLADIAALEETDGIRLKF